MQKVLVAIKTIQFDLFIKLKLELSGQLSGQTIVSVLGVSIQN